MNNKRILELGKTLLIVLLTCSAVWLAVQSPLFGQLPGERDGEGAEQPILSGTAVESDSAAVPLRIAVISEGGFFAVQYTDQQMQELFGQVTHVLGEALADAQEPLAVEQEQWRSALVTAPGIFLDFRTEIPLSVLNRWTSDRVNPRLPAFARYVVLSGGEDGVELYFHSELDGSFFLCRVPSVNAESLKTIAAQTEPNGAIFAYQSDHYHMVSDYTLIDAQTPSPRDFAVSNPLEQGEGRLEELLERLSFPVGITTVYDTPEGRRARSGNDTLTISDDGTVIYDGQEVRYPVEKDDSRLTAAVDGAWELVRGVLEPWCGQARLYLSGVENLGQDRWRVSFGYVLDNVPVYVGEGGYAARVLVENASVRQMELRLRSFAPMDSTTMLLPTRQAAAILAENGQQGKSLELYYREAGGVLRAGWKAGT